MPNLLGDVRAISALVPMARLLDALRFSVNERTRRGPCLLHSGSNPTAFSWREDGRWHCFSCGAGGDRIALVRAVRQCSFREAVEFVAALAGVEFRSRRFSPQEIAERARQRERAECAAWRVHDEIGRLRHYYRDCLGRAERLQARIGDGLLRASADAETDGTWEQLRRLAPVSTFFLAALWFLANQKPDVLAHFVLNSAAERRRWILDGDLQ